MKKLKAIGLSTALALVLTLGTVAFTQLEAFASNEISSFHFGDANSDHFNGGIGTSQWPPFCCRWMFSRP